MDYQFYPTPQLLAHIVWSSFSTEPTLVLDPQAGNGDLTTARLAGFPDLPDDLYEKYCAKPEFFRRTKWRASGPFSWHACEIDPSRHPMLKSKGAVIVGHDFFQMNSAAQYSHVVSNPPFRDGVKHLLHAWKIAFGAEIGCILNAESIRNPWNAERREVVDLIDKHGSVIFLKDQFLGEGVERETPVEVAVVTLKKVPQTVFNMEGILSGLKPAQNLHHTFDNSAPLNALALPIDFIDRIVEDYEIATQAALRLAEAEAVMAGARSRMGHTFTEMQAKGLDAETKPPVVPCAELIRKSICSEHAQLQERAWGQVLRSTKVLDKLSVSAQKNVESQFGAISQMEFSRSNIHGFFVGLFQSMGEINGQMLADMFDLICGKDTDNVAFFQCWKSNEKHKALGMRIKRTRFILPLARNEYSRYKETSFEVKSVLSDIDKVCYLLDPKPSVDEQNQRDGKGRLSSAEKAHRVLSAESSQLGVGLTDLVSIPELYGRLVKGERLNSEYWSLRFFPGMGTFHFFPRNMEVIERLNRYVGKLRQWLPPDMESATKDFKKQYEQAEKLTPKFLEEIKKANALRSVKHPAYVVLATSNDAEGRQADAERLTLVLKKFHSDLGIHVSQVIDGPQQQHQQLLTL